MHNDNKIKKKGQNNDSSRDDKNAQKISLAGYLGKRLIKEILKNLREKSN